MAPKWRFARRQVGHLKILPAHAPPPARADGFHARLFGRESRGKTFAAVGFALDVGDLGRRVNALDEAPAMALNGRANARNFGQIHSRAHYQVNPPCRKVPLPIAAARSNRAALVCKPAAANSYWLRPWSGWMAAPPMPEAVDWGWWGRRFRLPA